MAKVNYGPPLPAPSVRSTKALRQSFGPGLAVGVTQQSAELVTTLVQAAPRRR